MTSTKFSKPDGQEYGNKKDNREESSLTFERERSQLLGMRRKRELKQEDASTESSEDDRDQEQMIFRVRFSGKSKDKKHKGGDEVQHIKSIAIPEEGRDLEGQLRARPVATNRVAYRKQSSSNATINIQDPVLPATSDVEIYLQRKMSAGERLMGELDWQRSSDKSPRTEMENPY
ncbi:hypothetical protein Tco_0821500 [Tanacetum coccineum]|uniref:Uncharacterized protein n=1 Tax=Tanacetum coccineum TaxID=301880 RepID=A0ABQ5AGM7_9ASTR